MLVVINELNRNGPQRLPERDGSSPPPYFYDANEDGFITPNDVLVVINFLNSQVTGEGEFSWWIAPVASGKQDTWGSPVEGSVLSTIDEEEKDTPYMPILPSSRRHMLIDRLLAENLEDLLSKVDLAELLDEGDILSHLKLPTTCFEIQT